MFRPGLVAALHSLILVPGCAIIDGKPRVQNRRTVRDIADPQLLQMRADAGRPKADPKVGTDRLHPPERHHHLADRNQSRAQAPASSPANASAAPALGPALGGTPHGRSIASSPATGTTASPAAALEASSTSAPAAYPTAGRSGSSTAAPSGPTSSPIEKSTESPNATSPTAASTPALRASLSPASIVSAKGDPHMVNVLGQHFDIMQPGIHVLLKIPYAASRSRAFLWVDADAERIGGACADTYFQSVNISGRWAASNPGAHTFASFRGFGFDARTRHDRNDRKWISFGKVSLKVVHGRTKDGVPYLNFLVRNLKFAGHVVGGLLGEDDHTAAETPSLKCRKVLDI